MNIPAFDNNIPCFNKNVLQFDKNENFYLCTFASIILTV